MHIINTYAPALDWWLDMAQQEQGSKGKRGRELRIVLPRGYEHYVNADLNDANADEDEEENESEAESKGNADDDLAKKSAEPETGDASTTSKPQETNEPSASCSTKPAQFSTALGLFFDEHESFAFKYRPYILGQGSITGNLAPSATPQDFSSHTFQQAQWRANDSFPSFDSKSSSGTHEALTKQEHIDGLIFLFLCPEFLVTNYKIHAYLFIHSANCEAAKSKTPFDMSVCMAFQHIFLKTEESALLLNAFRDIVNIQHRVEFAKIQSFLTDGEFSPRLISLYNPVSFTSMEAIPHQIGDQSNVGRRYRLEGISDTNDLETAILSLGELYQQARSFELTDLIYLITLKLQVAWNSYPALYHLKPLLKITALIFPNAYDENTHDALQYWMLHFFAETYDLFTYDCPDMFWSVMRANPDLREGVMKLRSGLMTENPMLYSDSQALIRSRGVEKL
jgi:hypothetical protein